MDKSLMAGTILGTAVAAGGGASVHYATQSQGLAALAPPAQVLQQPAAELAPPPVAVVEQSRAPTARAVPAKAPPRTPAAAPPPAFARVLSVRPIEETVQTPRQQCYEQPVAASAPVRDKHQIAGIVGGALLGGVLGHQVGDGRGKDVATVAGAAAGALGGRMAQQQVQAGRTAAATATRCDTVMDSEVRVKEYEVRYDIGGAVATVRMPYDPGERIPLSNGTLLI